MKEKDLLRFSTAGNVDDGKSTLIGRLLFDSHVLLEDQLASIRRNDHDYDFALLLDGLRAEREQGITIDVAHRYFSTNKRKFIIIDTPGHIQYTRNMVTGASMANLALLLVDARRGISEQTCRHALISSLLRIQHIILCVNKMDLVGYSEEVYDHIVEQFKDFASRLETPDIQFIPISALHGDNVVKRSEKMPWYQGNTLLFALENAYVGSDHNHIDPRLPVQSVIRPKNEEHHDFRGFAGYVASGVFKPGDDVIVLPSGFTTKIRSIHCSEQSMQEAFHPMSIVLTTMNDVDISRGDMIAKPHNQPIAIQDVDMLLCWFSENKLQNGGRYVLRHTTREVKCLVKDVHYKIDVNTLRKDETNLEVGLNDIARVRVRTTQPIFCDSYKRNRLTGSVILIDEATNHTLAAGMILLQ
ncbi:MAG: sulfate adenylyltransferase subunit 1 [Verrucomicrobiota bacterium]